MEAARQELIELIQQMLLLARVADTRETFAQIDMIWSEDAAALCRRLAERAPTDEEAERQRNEEIQAEWARPE